MNTYKDKAITIIVTLINATGAEFEDENMAIDIIADNLEKENKYLLEALQIIFGDIKRSSKPFTKSEKIEIGRLAIKKATS